jgi:uncharacterized protein YjiK
MRFLNFPVRLSATLLLAVLFIAGCKAKKKIIKSPPHYNFAEVQIHKLDLKLKEISGLAWDRERDEFLAHYDEAGKLFFLDKETKAIKPGGEITFGAKGDYEDVAIYKGVPYVLRSDGTIFKILRDSAGITGAEAGKVGIGGVNDFETMYADTTRGALIILCKNCEADNKKVVSAYAYYPDSAAFGKDPVYSIDVKQVEALTPHKTTRIEPSAAGIHPILKKLFIISSAANLMVIADLNGKPEAAFELGKKLFPQPEGLTFKSNGDMYISNEGVTSRSTILRFVYKP